jgi:hypothetical protein
MKERGDLALTVPEVLQACRSLRVSCPFTHLDRLKLADLPVELVDFVSLRRWLTAATCGALNNLGIVKALCYL